MRLGASIGPRCRAAPAARPPLSASARPTGRRAVALFLTALASFAAATPALGQTPTVTIKAGPAAVEGGSAMFTFEASGLTGAIRVGFELSHQRAYTSLFTRRISLSDQNGSSSVRPVPLIKNGKDEPDGWMRLKVLPGDGYVVGSPSQATVPVADADPTTVALSAPAGDIAEGGDKTLGVSLGRALWDGEDLTVALTFGGSAAFGTDYSLSAPDPPPTGVSYANLSSDDLANKPPSIVFTGGANISSTAGVILEGLTDDVDEASETVTVGLGALTAGAGLGGGAQAEAGGVSFSIDDATDIEVGIEAKTSPVTEGASAAFTLTADPAPIVDTTVKVKVSQSGSYVATGDLGSKEVLIKAGAATAELAAATDGDSTDEPPGGATATVQAGDGYVVASANAATVTVQDDDPTTVTLEVTGSEAVEGSGVDVGRFRVTLGRPLARGESLGVPLLFSGGTAGTNFTLKLVNRDDHGDPQFDAAAKTVTFRATGHSKSAAELLLRAVVDSGDKDEVVVVDIPRASTAAPGMPVLAAGGGLHGGAAGARTGDGEITLLDTERTYRISGGDAVDEGGTASFTVQANRKLASGNVVVVDITQEGDFVNASSLGAKHVAIAKGAASKALTVQTVGDDKDEAHGKVVATIVNRRGYNVAAPPGNTAAVTVNDDDEPPVGTSVVKLTSDAATVAESGGSTTIGLALAPAPAAELTLKYTLSGTASLGADYSIAGASNGAGALTVAKDAATASIPVTITDDALGEGDETVVLTLVDGTGYSVGKPGSLTLTITDDEPALTIAAGAATVAEGTAATFTVTADRSVAAALKVGVTLTGDGDFFGKDVLGAKEVTIAKGEKAASLSVPTAGDGADEPNGWVEATLEDRAAYTIPTSPDDSARTAVTDDDDPLPVVSINGGAGVTEGEQATFTIRARPAPRTSLKVKVTLSQTGDYAPAGDLGESTVTIGASGITTHTCPTVNDKADEEDGSVVATLLAGEGYLVAAPPGNEGAVPVNDDDGALTPPSVTLSAAPNPATEGQTISVTVSLSRALSSAVTIPLVLTAGTAEAGDYGSLASVAVAGGQRTGVGRLATNKDADADDEVLTVSLGELPASVRRGTPSTVTVMILETATGGPGGGGDGGGGGGTPPPPPPPPPGPPPVSGGPLRADFALDPSCEEEPCRVHTLESVTFQDTSGGGFYSRLWDFGDGSTSRGADPVHRWSAPGFYRVTLTLGDGVHESAASMLFLVEAARPAGQCVSDETTRCLRDSRFAVEAEWFLADGRRGSAAVVPEGTNDSALFRFFDSANWEVLLKILDGCAINQAVWVFAASTTDLGYSIRVTDTVTNQVRVYSNEPGTPAAAVTDAVAFPGSCEEPGSP